MDIFSNPEDKSQIFVSGARENNLKNISLAIPKRKITVFTGVSGSGKSSLVFDTIAAESSRQLNDTFSSYIRNQLPHYGKPDVDELRNLSVAIIVDQKRIGGNARSTVGTITDINPLLRLLFSRIGKPFVGYSNIFSFNNPQGMCSECEGLGKVNDINVAKLFDRNLSLNEGAIRFPTFEPGGWRWTRYVHSGLFDNDKKLKDYTEEEWNNLLYVKSLKLENPAPEWHKTSKYEGVIPRLERTFLKRNSKSADENYKEELENIIQKRTCPKCNGARLNQKVLKCRILGMNIADCCAMPVKELLKFMDRIERTPVSTPIVTALSSQLQHLSDIGLDYLSLDRETSTLSGGESQRIKMVRHLGSSLTDITYIFDEPSVGLHPADVDRLNKLLLNLRDKGNTILIVEHDPDVISIADHIVDIGPGAGKSGGEITFQGDCAGLKKSGTLTGKYLSTKTALNTAPRQHRGHLDLANVSLHNLHNISVKIPKGVMTVVTGVAGSGKSTLIDELLVEKYPDIKLIDQTALQGKRRSNIATYTGIMNSIRNLFATENKVSPSLFSSNSEGACPQCKGLGEIHTDLAFMDDVVTPCEQCNGSGFKQEVLKYMIQGKNISEILSLTVSEATTFFEGSELQPAFERLSEVGLDYITLGQPLNTFSGGECQRVKLATALETEGEIYVFDEPTTGLHPSDTDRLMRLFNRLLDKGCTLIVIEHNLHVISRADWIIDIGVT